MPRDPFDLLAKACRSLLLGSLLSLSAGALGLGCAAERFDGRVYLGHGMHFRVGPEPAGWAKIEARPALLAFRAEAEHATVYVNGRCGQDGDDVPLPALTEHLFIQLTEREVEEQQVMPFDRREAQRTVLIAKLDGVPKRFETFVLKKDGCVYDFVLIAEPSRFAAARAPFERFVGGFRTEGSP